MDGGWRPHPDAIGIGASRRPPVEPGRVVGIGAVCDVASPPSGGRADQRFVVGEFVTLDDGRRVMLHEDRGFTLGWRSSGASHPGVIQRQETLESLTRDVLNVVLGDDDACAEGHPWPWLAELARARGLDVAAEDLRRLRYEVVFTEDVRRWLAPD